MCFDADYSPEFFNEDWRRARKEHRCDECRKAIEKGQSYKYISGKWDGEISVYKVCTDCDTLREKIAAIELGRGCSSSESYCPLGALMEEKEHYKDVLGH